MTMQYEDYVPYQALIFDCDGTLTQSMPLHYVAWKKALMTVGMEFEEETFYALAGMPGEKVISKVAGDLGRSVDIETMETILKHKDQRFMETIDKLQPFEFTVDIAKRFHGEKPLAVASGGTQEDVIKQLTHLNIDHLFDAVVTAEDTQNHKPHPDVFLEAASRLGVSACDCLVFEDGDLGIEAAKRANMDFVDVRECSNPPGSSPVKP